MTIDQEITKAVKTLRELTKEFTPAKRRAFLRPAAKIVERNIKANAPESEKAHHRYATEKLIQGMRAPKGMGNIIATYQPGNLKRSIKIMLFTRSPDLFVGPKVSKKGRAISAADGYYAKWVEYGSVNSPARPFIRPAAETSKSAVANSIKEELKKLLTQFEEKHKI